MAGLEETMKLQLISGELKFSSTIDIILVHGPGQTAEQCWTADAAIDTPGCMWPRDLVGQGVSEDARVFAFDYSAYADNPVDILSPNKIKELSEGLLDTLQSSLPVPWYGYPETPDTEIRTPIAFVAHGIGGILVKQALLTAATSTRHSNIMDQCKVLIFFGSPQRATLAIESWDEILANLSTSPNSSWPHQSNRVTTMARDLVPFLDEVSREFINLSPYQSIINIIQHVNTTENARRIMYSRTTGLIHEFNITRECRHIGDIGKFSAQNIVLSQLFDRLKAFKYVPNIFVKTRFHTHGPWLEGDKLGKYGMCLSYLAKLMPPFVIPHETQRYLRGYQGQLHDEYLAWLSSSSSDVITTATQPPVTEGIDAIELFRESQGRGIHSCYFSFSRTDMRRASVSALLASLTFQILIHDPERFGRVRAFYDHMQENQIRSQCALAALFRSVLDTKSHSGPIHFIIDGLHRLSSPQEAIDVLWAAFSKEGDDPNAEDVTKIKLALFYRETSDAEEEKAKNALAKFDGSRVHICLPYETPLPFNSDAPIYKALYAIKDKSSLKPKALWTLKQYIESRRAFDGVFPGLEMKEQDDLVKSTSANPVSLENVIFGYLEKLEDWARTALGWLLYSKRPLSVNELATAIAITDKTAKLTGTPDNDILSHDIVSGLRDAFGFILTVETGGVSFSTRNIRRCCQSFLSKELDEIPSFHASQKATIPMEADVTSLILQYLSLPEFLGPMSEAIKAGVYIQPTGILFNLASYAVQFWAAHYRDAVRVNSSNRFLLGILHNYAILPMLPSLFCKFDKPARTTIIFNTKYRRATPRLIERINRITTTLGDLAVRFGLDFIVEEMVKDFSQEQCDRAIGRAAYYGHTNVVEILLRRTPGSDSRLVSDMSPDGNMNSSIIKLLLGHKGTQTATQPERMGFVSQATCIADKTLVSDILNHFAIQRPSDINGPLQLAASFGHVSIVRVLLDKLNQLKMDYTDNSGDAPIARAAESGHDRVIKYLLPLYENIDVLKNKGFQVALKRAVEGAHEVALRLLLERLSAIEPAEPSADAYRLEKTNLLGPLLRCALRQGNCEMASLLLQHNPNFTESANKVLSYADEFGNRFEPLVLSILDRLKSTEDIADIEFHIQWAAEQGLTKVIERCISLQPKDTNIEILFSPIDGSNPVHVAAKEGHLETVRLLSQYIRCDEPNKNQLTPLALAAASGHVSTVKFLLEYESSQTHAFKPMAWGGSILNERTRYYSRIVLHVASCSVQKGQAQVIKLLLMHGADPNMYMSLFEASYHSNLEVVQMLLQQGADINAKNGSREHALHFAASSRHRDARKVCEVLIEANCNPLVADIGGVLPFHKACQSGNTQVLDLLSTYGEDIVNVKAELRRVLSFGAKSLETLEWLFKRGEFDVNAIAGRESNILTSALFGYGPDCARMLLKHNIIGPLDQEIMEEALYEASRCGDLEMAKFLVSELKINVNATGEKHGTALIAAIVEGDSGELVDFLLDQNADPNIPGGDFANALAAAKKHNLYKIVKRLEDQSWRDTDTVMTS
ncbi:ankyrin repeat-containing domain protein [Nemania sp. FL0031]|nr:ankyrin repeat-containing domain protein [Nemania sp. FL0031]